MRTLRSYYESLLSNPNVQRALSVISKAEGADYYTLVGEGTNNKGLLRYGTSKHPKDLGYKGVYNPRVGQYSTAAGRYQIVGSTWKGLQRAGIVGESFSPREQDIAAIALIAEKGALNDVIGGNVGGFFSKTRGTWESFKLRGLNYVSSLWNGTGGGSSGNYSAPLGGEYQQATMSANGQYSSVFGEPFQGTIIPLDAETKRAILLAIAVLIVLFAVVNIWL